MQYGFLLVMTMYANSTDHVDVSRDLCPPPSLASTPKSKYQTYRYLKLLYGGRKQEVGTSQRHHLAYATKAHCCIKLPMVHTVHSQNAYGYTGGNLEARPNNCTSYVHDSPNESNPASERVVSIHPVLATLWYQD